MINIFYKHPESQMFVRRFYSAFIFKNRNIWSANYKNHSCFSGSFTYPSGFSDAFPIGMFSPYEMFE